MSVLDWLLANSGWDWLAAALGIVAQTLIRRRRSSGYALSIITQSMYLYFFITHGLTGLTLLIVFNLGNAVVGWYQWRAIEGRALRFTREHHETRGTK